MGENATEYTTSRWPGRVTQRTGPGWISDIPQNNRLSPCLARVSPWGKRYGVHTRDGGKGLPQRTGPAGSVKSHRYGVVGTAVAKVAP